MRLGDADRRVYALLLKVAGVVALILAPWLPPLSTQPSLVQAANLAGEYALIAMSLVILTGWVGQISLGQGAFVGIGAFATGLLAREAGIPFPLNLPIVVAVTAGVATLLGLVALRVRGLYLAVATLIFAYVADKFLFTSAWLVGEGGSSTIPNRTIGRPGTVTFFDFRSKEVFYLVVLAAVAGAWYAAMNLRESKTGRAFFAVRGSETAAVSLGIDVTRYKLLAFALSGALAGIAGTLMMTDLKTATPTEFDFTKSLFYLGIAVTGGIGSLGGAVAAGGAFAFLNAIGQLWDTPVTRALADNLDIVSVGLLLVVLLVYPGGLGAAGSSATAGARERARRIRRRRPASATPSEMSSDAAPGAPAPRRRRGIQRRALDFSHLESDPRDDELPVIGSAAAQPAHRDWRTAEPAPFDLPADRSQRAPILEARNIVVRFGGLTAADDVTVEVRTGEIVGLIGPNGAGKTTTFNAIAGLNEPASGTVRLYGEDATAMPVHLRAQMGVGRTFQLIQLFPQLSVFENLLVATHLHNETGVLRHLTLTDAAIEAERDARRSVRQIIAMLGLEDVADRRVAGLPFGVLRHVELARALVTRAPLLMLDEPASGLDNTETDEFARLLKFIRAELGVSILLIEHDVRMVTSVCDYIYVINRGMPLADGTASEIQRHPDVVAAYLGEAVHA
ncbi:MAG TPA: branched-chain amino acid ABC transporter ATP-binding protein/permease [Actinomycetota bacterium]